MKVLPRIPLDKDYLLTTDGLYFCVFSYLHPPDGYTAYLQYLPGPPGSDPRRGRIKPMDFPHVGAVAGTMDWLREHYPHYVRFCPVRSVELPLVPKARVARYYQPGPRLEQVLAEPRDLLEAEVAEFAQVLARASGLPLTAFGVTGSVLLDVHDPDSSDMDLVVYGTAAAARVREAVLVGRVPDLAPMRADRVERWLRLMSTHHPITRDEAAYFVGRRWNYGFFRGREFSIKAVRTPAEVTEAYGARTYQGVGLVTVRGRVADAAEAAFLPAVYRLEGVEVVAGPSETPADAVAGPPVAPADAVAGPPVALAEVVAFEGLYQGAFDPGQAVEVCGKLERASDGTYRVVVGSAEYRGREYMKPLAE